MVPWQEGVGPTSSAFASTTTWTTVGESQPSTRQGGILPSSADRKGPCEKRSKSLKHGQREREALPSTCNALREGKGSDLDESRLLRGEVDLSVLDVEIVVLEDFLPFLCRATQAGPFEIVLGVDLLVSVSLDAGTE